MRLLLDTHAFVWFVGGNTRLSSAARSAIEDLVNVRLLSAASMWEIAIKVSLGKLSLNVPFGVIRTAALVDEALTSLVA
jgi:PIN domain nuclease of toxin-antitoxin system